MQEAIRSYKKHIADLTALLEVVDQRQSFKLTKELQKNIDCVAVCVACMCFDTSSLSSLSSQPAGRAGAGGRAAAAAYYRTGGSSSSSSSSSAIEEAVFNYSLSATFTQICDDTRRDQLSVLVSWHIKSLNSVFLFYY